MHRILIELSDGTELEIRRRGPPIIDTTAEALDDETSGVRDALAMTPRPLARCAPEPSLTEARRVRGHLRALPRVA